MKWVYVVGVNVLVWLVMERTVILLAEKAVCSVKLQENAPYAQKDTTYNKEYANNKIQQKLNNLKKSPVKK